MAELADFHPGTGHRHNCAKTTIGSDAHCTQPCAEDLYEIAQTQERALTRVQGVVHMWQPSSPHPQPCIPCSLREQVQAALNGIPHD